MSRDILSMIGKSKSTKPVKELSSQAKTTITTVITSKQSTHNTTIIDTYLIKITPRTPFLYNDIQKVSIISFDLDGTLINTKSGSKFARGSQDWKWFNDKTLSKLKEIRNMPIVIFTNQGGIVATKTSKSYMNFHTRVQLILKELANNDVDVQNIWVYASPKKAAGYKGDKGDASHFEKMRKPNFGMFKEFVEDFGGSEKINFQGSYFVGDAAGRKNDFSDSDLKFASNCNLQFKTPEEYFV